MFDELTMEQKIKYILTGLDALDVAAGQLRQGIKDIETRGYCNATEWWKDGKYLYLIHPTDKGGHRTREYIGSCPHAVTEARNRIIRYNELVDARARLQDIEYRRQDAKSNFDRAILALGATQKIMDVVKCE